VKIVVRTTQVWGNAKQDRQRRRGERNVAGGRKESAKLANGTSNKGETKGISGGGGREGDRKRRTQKSPNTSHRGRLEALRVYAASGKKSRIKGRAKEKRRTGHLVQRYGGMEASPIHVEGKGYFSESTEIPGLSGQAYEKRRQCVKTKAKKPAHKITQSKRMGLGKEKSKRDRASEGRDQETPRTAETVKT